MLNLILHLYMTQGDDDDDTFLATTLGDMERGRKEVSEVSLKHIKTTK